MSHSYYGDNTYGNNSKIVLDDNKNIKRKTIDEQDESYAMDEFYDIDRKGQTWRNKNKAPLFINAKIDCAPINDTESSTANAENKPVYKNTVLPIVANTQQYQTCCINGDITTQTVESPLSERQKKQLALLNRRNPAHHRRPKTIPKIQLQKYQHEDKKDSDEEYKYTRNEMPQGDENMKGHKHETKMKKGEFMEYNERFNDVVLTPKRDEYYHAFNGENANKPLYRNHRSPIEVLSPNRGSDIKSNSNDEIKYTTKSSKECLMDQYQHTSSWNHRGHLIRATRAEHEMSSMRNIDTDVNNIKAQQNSFSNTSEIKKNIRITTKENTKSEGLNLSTESGHPRKRSSFHSSSSIFDDTEKGIISISGLSFSATNKNDISSANQFTEQFTSKNQLKIMRSNSPITTNEKENIFYMVPKDNYVMREKCNILKKKKKELAQDPGKDPGLMDYSQGSLPETKVEINLDYDIRQKDLTKFSYKENYEPTLMYQKNVSRKEETPNKMKELEKMSIKKNEADKVEILIKGNKKSVAHEIDTTKTAMNIYPKYDDIPCKGIDTSNITSLLSNDFYTSYGSEPSKIKTDHPSKTDNNATFKTKSNYSINTSNYTLDTEDLHNSYMENNNKIKGSNVTTTDSTNNSKYNRFGDGKMEHSEQKYTNVSIDKTAVSKGHVNKSTPRTNKMSSSSKNKKGTAATVTSKIKTDNVTYVTFDELTEFPQAMSADRISEMMNDIIEKSKNNDWTKQIEDLINLRRIMKYYTKIFFDEQSKDLRKIIRAVVELINSPRSCVSKNALLCLIEFYNAGKKKTDCTIEDVLLPCLKKAHQTSVDFISSAANNALLAICNACSENKLILYFIKQLTSKQKTYNLLCLRCLIAVLIKFDQNVIKFKEADKLVEAILGCTVVGSAEIKCTARVALVVLENACPIRKLCSKHISAADIEKIDMIIDKTSENEIDIVLGKIAVC